MFFKFIISPVNKLLICEVLREIARLRDCEVVELEHMLITIIKMVDKKLSQKYITE